MPDLDVRPFLAVARPPRTRIFAVVKDVAVLVAHFDSCIRKVNPTMRKLTRNVELKAVQNVPPAIKKLDLLVEKDRERAVDISVAEIWHLRVMSAKTR